MLLCSGAIAGCFDVLMAKHDYMSACQQYVLCELIHLIAGHPSGERLMDRDSEFSAFLLLLDICVSQV